MNERLTPEQVIWPLECTPGSVERHLAEHGYVIVDAERFAWLERVEEAASDMPIDLDDWIGDDQ